MLETIQKGVPLFSADNTNVPKVTQEDMLHLTHSLVTSALLGSFDNEQQEETTKRSGYIWHSDTLEKLFHSEVDEGAEPALVFEWSPTRLSSTSKSF